jgi:dTDP-4-amino-4,6-dideoxygalactose transaminase
MLRRSACKSRPPARADYLRRLSARGVNSVSRYVPLHDAPAGLRYARTSGLLPVTDDVAGRLVRLPLHPAMDESDVDYVVEAVVDEIAAWAPSRRYDRVTR